jgi:hypothetical protein
MRIPRSRWTIPLLIASLLVVPGAWLFTRGGDAPTTTVSTKVKQGDFRVVVTTAGELRAVKFVQVQGPPNAQQAESYQMKIASIVPERTVVKEGDVVAELDRSGIAAKRAEVFIALQKAEAQLEQAQLDSTLNLSKAREDMKTMELQLEEKKIAKEQSIYEAPSIRRQAEIDYEKAERALAQAKVDYKTKTEQAQAKMRGGRGRAAFASSTDRRSVMEDSPSGAGRMVIYVKWNGKEDSQLPDQLVGSDGRDAPRSLENGDDHLRE